MNGESTVADRFQILSLDGGGIRGVFTAAILAAVEEDCGVRVVDCFDLLAGTSTGGILAIGLGLGFSPKEMVEFYVECGPRIFTDGSWRLLGPKYVTANLADVLTEKCGTQILSYVEPVDLIFYGVSGVALCVFRSRPPAPSITPSGDRATGFSVPGHPWTTGLFIIACWSVALTIVRANPRQGLTGLGILTLGIPVFALSQRRL